MTGIAARWTTPETSTAAAALAMSRAGAGERPALTFDPDDRVAAVAWSRLSETGDPQVGALLSYLGVTHSMGWLVDSIAAGYPLIEMHTGESWLGYDAGAWCQAVQRWAALLLEVSPSADLRAAREAAGRLLVHGDAAFPKQISELGALAPHALWATGHGLPRRARSAVAIVGREQANAAHEDRAERLARALTEQGLTIVTGARAGVEAAAIRGALDAGGSPVVVIDQGIDGLATGEVSATVVLAAAEGTIVTQLPPGRGRGAARFSASNRLIAALAGVTVVVDPDHDSRALSTARRAYGMNRQVAILAGGSVGDTAQRLLTECDAVAVSGADGVLTLSRSGELLHSR